MEFYFLNSRGKETPPSVSLTFHALDMGGIPVCMRLGSSMPNWYAKQLGGHAAHAKYLSLLESVLTGSVGGDVSECHPEQKVRLSRYGLKDGGVLGSCPSINTAPYSAQRRRIGRDWPTNGLTMIGKLRMRNIFSSIRTVVQTNIPGEFAELGVWRGGGSIFARAILDVFEQSNRNVHLFDAFQDITGYGDAMRFLSVPIRQVKQNFEQFGMADKGAVVFHKGFFNRTLPAFRSSFSQRYDGASIAVLRIDGNFWLSYHNALYYMWDFVPTGGIIIFDDIPVDTSGKSMARAWTEFKSVHNLSEELVEIDWGSSYLTKKSAIKVNWYAYSEAIQRNSQSVDLKRVDKN